MSIVVERASERRLSDLGWLKSAFSYSFAEYHNRTRMGFGSLRAFNDDSVAPLRGFGMHPHADMEIVTILLKGEIAHEDSMHGTQKRPLCPPLSKRCPPEPACITLSLTPRRMKN